MKFQGYFFNSEISCGTPDINKISAKILLSLVVMLYFSFISAVVFELLAIDSTALLGEIEELNATPHPNKNFNETS